MQQVKPAQAHKVVEQAFDALVVLIEAGTEGPVLFGSPE